MSEVLQILDSVDRSTGSRLSVDWTLLAIQCAMLLAVTLAELRRPRDRNLIAVLVVATMLVLVQGQDGWVLAKLASASYMAHLYQLITIDGARLANLYLTLALAAFTIVYFANRRPPSAASTRAVDRRTRLEGAAPSRPPYLLVVCWTAVSVVVLVVTLGGTADVLNSLGRIAAGQAGALMMLGVGKLPLCDAIAARRRPGVYDLALFALVFGLTLLSSRFLALFMLFQVAIVWNYGRSELPRSRLVLMAVGGILILVGFGLYRDLVSYFPAGTPVDALSIDQFRAERTSEGLVDWFYGLNVEGFAGFAGILSFTVLNGSLAHDYGLSTLAFTTQVIPNAWRTDPSLPFSGVAQALDQVYPYHGSIVPPGFELAYRHFGLIGVVTLGGLLAHLCRRLHERMWSPGTDWLLMALLSVQLMQVVRGTFVTVIVFGLADLVGLRLYRAMAAIEAGATGPAPAAADARAR